MQVLTQQDIDAIVNASRGADEGPTQLVRRVESAVQAAERERCAKIVEEYSPGGSYHIRSTLAAAIRRA